MDKTLLIQYRSTKKNKILTGVMPWHITFSTLTADASSSEALMHLKTTNLCKFDLFGKQLEIGAAVTSSDVYVLSLICFNK